MYVWTVISGKMKSALLQSISLLIIKIFNFESFYNFIVHVLLLDSYMFLIYLIYLYSIIVMQQ
jgi:hypothetical protein